MANDGSAAGAVSKIDGPDFIGIGMAKSATGWLFDQLKYHPDFWMPPIKELDYLRRREPKVLKTVEQLLARLRDTNRPPHELFGWANRRPGDLRDIQFLEETGIGTGIAAYMSLFRYKECRLSGDISPGYAGMEPALVAQISTAMPDTRIILLVRDPVSRAWSHTCMRRRSGSMDESAFQTARSYREFIETPRSLGVQPFPTRIIDSWTRHAPKLPFRCFLFDDIVANPAGTRGDILTYLGADPSKTSGTLPSGYNRKDGRDKVELTNDLKDVLVEYFREELLACADYFGGAARDWPKRYGL
ncbi:MAG TPA: sulfotransferase [Rhizomicrobium sp.]